MSGTKNVLEQSDCFSKTAYLKALFSCMVSILSGNINILVDGIIVGQKLGVNGLAALNLCMPVYLTLCVIVSFSYQEMRLLQLGAIGRNEEKRVQRFYHFNKAERCWISL